MPRLSIDISPEDHQKLTAIAALKGQSIKDYVLGRALGDAPALDGMSQDSNRRVAAIFPASQLKKFGAKNTSLLGSDPLHARLSDHSRRGRRFPAHLAVHARLLRPGTS